jgi:hypothetical protein
MLRRKYSILIVVLIFFISINFLLNLKTNEELSIKKELKKFFLTNKLQKSDRLEIKNPHNYKYILNPGSEICESNDERFENAGISLLSLVTSATYHFENRQAIRETWANKTLFPQTRTIFIIGKSNNETINQLLMDEYKTFGDIVQEDYMDTYMNLTIKTVAAMKWASQYCNNSKLVLKIGFYFLLLINRQHYISFKKIKKTNIFFFQTTI